MATLMRTSVVSTLLILLTALGAHAATNGDGESLNVADASEKTMPFRYDNGELMTILADYAKASGRKMIIDPGVRGRATVLVPAPVSMTEAWNIVNDVLSINGFSVVEVGDTTMVKSARNAQRDGIPTITEVPSARPNRMVTMVFTLKNISAEEVNKRLRILPSKDGEMTPYEPTNQIIVSDFATNIVHIADIIKSIDVPESQFFKNLKKDPEYIREKKETAIRRKLRLDADAVTPRASIAHAIPADTSPAPTTAGTKSPSPAKSK